MDEGIKIIIADDNIHICNQIRRFLEEYEDIKILGIANNDKEEIEMIERLKPDIVITDLMRNHKYTGLDIIKEYQNKTDSPEFLVITSYEEANIIREGIKIAGYIQKPADFKLILEKLYMIKEKMIRQGKI